MAAAVGYLRHINFHFICSRHLNHSSQIYSLYKLNLAAQSGGPPLPVSSLLLRIYGAGTENIIDRGVELALLDHLAVHAPHIAPITYVAFTNGRLEQFIDGAATLQASDMRDPATSLLIARRMASLHSLPLPPSVAPRPAVWGLIRDWLNGERDSIMSNQDSTAPDVQQQRLQTVEHAVTLLHELQPLLHADSTVLCHNDLLCGNILQELGGDRLYLIDYEFAPPLPPSPCRLTAVGTAPPTLLPLTSATTSTSGRI